MIDYFKWKLTWIIVFILINFILFQLLLLFYLISFWFKLFLFTLLTLFDKFTNKLLNPRILNHFLLYLFWNTNSRRILVLRFANRMVFISYHHFLLLWFQISVCRNHLIHTHYLSTIPVFYKLIIILMIIFILKLVIAFELHLHKHQVFVFIYSLIMFVQSTNFNFIRKIVRVFVLILVLVFVNILLLKKRLRKIYIYEPATWFVLFAI